MNRIQELEEQLQACKDNTTTINKDLQKIASALKGVYSLVQQIINISLKH